MAVNPEQTGIFTQLMQNRLHLQWKSMKPLIEQLTAATSQGQGGQGRNFAESLNKRTDVLKSSGFEGWQF